MSHSSITPANQALDAAFIPYSQSKLYPKSIKRQLARKNSNLAKAIKTLKAPSRQLFRKEVNQLSKLGKAQETEFDKILSQSSSKQEALKQEENLILTELTRKRVNIEDPSLEVRSVFMLPSKSKRKKWENKSIEQSREVSKNMIAEELQSVSMFTTEVVEVKKQVYEESSKNGINMEEILYFEPEILFREIDNLECIDMSMKELIKNEDFNFPEEIFQQNDKENEVFIEDSIEPYIPPPFARVFRD